MKRRKNYEMPTKRADGHDSLSIGNPIRPVKTGAKSFDFDRWRFVGSSIADTDIGAV